MNLSLPRIALQATTMAALIALSACASKGPMLQTTTQSVTLTGENEVPAFASAANGNGTFTVATDGTVFGSMTAYNFTPTMGHIHMGAPGVNGPVIVPMVASGFNTLTVPEGTKLTPEQLAAYKAGNLYVNLHSVAHPGGEARAQLKGL